MAANRRASASAGPTTIAAIATTAAITTTVISECGREQCRVCWGLADYGEAQK
jgi:hypothetical protein